MGKGRLEAFSDGVLAIIITIMVLELKPPHSTTWSGLLELGPIFGSYVLSFVYVGIYWNNHHHLLHTARHVTGGILWANLHLLFWLSLLPFATAYTGENHFSAVPTLLYGVVLFASGFAYYLLQLAIIAKHGKESVLGRAIGDRDVKSRISMVGYAIAIGLAWFAPVVSFALYGAVALVWLVPDRRIESALSAEAQEH